MSAEGGNGSRSTLVPVVNTAAALKEFVRDEEFLRLVVQTRSVREAAKLSKWSYATALKACKRSEFMIKLREYSESVWAEVDEELAAYRLNVTERLEEASAECLEQMFELAKGAKNETVKLKAAQDLMDRDPRISRTRKIEGGSPKVELNFQVLQLAANAIKEEKDFLERKRVEQAKLIEMPVEGPPQ